MGDDLEALVALVLEEVDHGDRSDTVEDMCQRILAAGFRRQPAISADVVEAVARWGFEQNRERWVGLDQKVNTWEEAQCRDAWRTDARAVLTAQPEPRMAAWAVDPEDESDSRPSDAYDIVLADDRSEDVATNLTHARATEIANSHNASPSVQPAISEEQVKPHTVGGVTGVRSGDYYAIEVHHCAECKGWTEMLVLTNGGRAVEGSPKVKSRSNHRRVCSKYDAPPADDAPPTISAERERAKDSASVEVLDGTYVVMLGTGADTDYCISETNDRDEAEVIAAAINRALDRAAGLVVAGESDG